MTKKPKTATQINSPLVRVVDVMKFQEAAASWDCTKCTLGKEYRKQIIREVVEEIEKNSYISGSVDSTRKRIIKESWCQHLRKKWGIE